MVESQAIYRGIRDGYATIAEKGRYSPCVLFVELPIEEVDVNVHPAKREVRFKHEYRVSYVIEEAIKNNILIQDTQKYQDRIEGIKLTNIKE
jgi:DNA mismatch repair protein MutL